MRLLALVVAVLLAAPAMPAHAGQVGDGGSEARSARTSTTGRPLAGKVVVIDPGHQLGNHNFPSKINRPVPAGGFRKPCNTTGTATNGGYPEATMAWRVSKLLQARLERAGATVKLTRSPPDSTSKVPIPVPPASSSTEPTG